MLTCLPLDWQEPAAITLVLDATNIGRPFPSSQWHTQIGIHEDAIHVLFREHGVADGSWLRQAVRKIARVVVGPVHSRVMAGLMQAGGGHAVAAPLVSILVYCAHGKHRSVGLAYLLADGFPGAGFDRTSEEHLCQRMWSRHGGCGNSWSCRPCNPTTNSLIAHTHPRQYH